MNERTRVVWQLAYFVISAAVLGVVVFLVRCEKRHAHEALEPNAFHATMVDGADGPVLLVFADVSGNGDVFTRVQAFDVTTGAAAARELDGTTEGCVTATKDTMWCSFGRGAMLLDTATLATIATADQLLAPLHAPRNGVDVYDGALWTHLDDGRWARVDADRAISFHEREPDGRSILERYDACATESGIELDGVPWSVSASRRILRGAPDAETTATPGPSYGEVAFLLDDLGGRPLAVDGEPVILADGAVMRVAADGGPRWRVPLDGACLFASGRGGTLVIATKGPARAVAIDLATGTPTWRPR